MRNLDGEAGRGAATGKGTVTTRAQLFTRLTQNRSL
jgi:hypothetical protein